MDFSFLLYIFSLTVLLPGVLILGGLGFRWMSIKNKAVNLEIAKFEYEKEKESKKELLQ